MQKRNMDFQVYAPSGHVVRCSYHIVAAGSKPAGHTRPEGPCSGGVRSSTVDDQTNGIGQLLYDIRDHVATQQTSEGSAV